MKGKIGKVTVEIDNKEFSINVEEELLIDEKNLNADIVEQPAKFVWVSVLYARAKKESLDSKLAFDIAIAEISTVIRNKMEKELEKKPTEAQINTAVTLSKEFKKYSIKMIEARETESILSGIVAAFAQRKDMIQTIASNIRVYHEQGIDKVSRESKRKTK